MISSSIIRNQLLQDGMQEDDIDYYFRELDRIIAMDNGMFFFIQDCEKKGINPTLFRYKKYIKTRQAELKQFRHNFKQERGK